MARSLTPAPARLLAPPVPGGIRSIRRRVRRWGTAAGLVIPAAIGLLAWRVLDGSDSLARSLVGVVLATLAAPTIPILGLPIEGGGGRLRLAIALAGAMWLGLSILATLRATRAPVAGWREWWREYLGLAIGTWIGALLALAVATLVLGWSFR